MALPPPAPLSELESFAALSLFTCALRETLLEAATPEASQAGLWGPNGLLRACCVALDVPERVWTSLERSTYEDVRGSVSALVAALDEPTPGERDAASQASCKLASTAVASPAVFARDAPTLPRSSPAFALLSLSEDDEPDEAARPPATAAAAACVAAAASVPAAADAEDAPHVPRPPVHASLRPPHAAPQRRARRADAAFRPLLLACVGASGGARYDARARVALRRTARFLRLTKSDVTALEAEVGASRPNAAVWPRLGTADVAEDAAALAGDPPPPSLSPSVPSPLPPPRPASSHVSSWLSDPLGASKASSSRASSASASDRSFKVAAAAAAGATLLALTAGLAAPAILAGAAALSGGAALTGGAGAAAGAAIAGGFGAAGGGVAARSMARRTAPLTRFSFVPVTSEVLEPGGTPREDDAEEATHCRLAVTLCVSGWLSTFDDVVAPWRRLSSLDAERVALVWEPDQLLALGDALQRAAGDAGTAELLKAGAAHTILQGILTAVALPAACLTAASLIDNSWARVLDRADQAGELLAAALVDGGWYHRRPVTLLGYSFGARVIFTALRRLALSGAVGVVESAVLLGAPVPSCESAWAPLRFVVAGRLVNVHSDGDWVLALAHRAASLDLGGPAAGLAPVSTRGVENFDVSHLVAGHTAYPAALPALLRLVSGVRGEARKT